jgi:myo-inositol-1(or 4)-monophosphatase
LFFSRKGTGAYLNGETIHVSAIRDLKQALLSTGFPYNIATTERNNIDHFINFLFKAQAVRRDGSAALNLCYVACGRFDAFWELTLNSWDMAAGSLIIGEAGGTVTNLEDNEFSVYKETIVASNGFLHEDVLKVLNGK